MFAEPPHALSIAAVAQALGSDPNRGLTNAVAAARLDEYGRNALQEAPRPGLLALFLAQFRDFVVWLLLAAALISAVVGSIEGDASGYIEAAAILAIVLLNAAIGVVQEYRAENAFRALEAMATPEAHVLRSSRRVTVPAPELVPGDLVVLEAGNFVPADLRLTESANLQVAEAALTGESQAVPKAAEPILAPDTALAEQLNRAFSGTLVTYGRGQGLITATGMHTEIGRIAALLDTYERGQTPLQEKLESLGKTLGAATLVICGFVFAIGLARATDIAQLFDAPAAYFKIYSEAILAMFMIAVSLAIAAVPEGLPAVVTVVLSVGMQRMAKRHALIRRLAAVETLGSTTTICTDKTGTLTKNEMAVVQVELEGHTLAVDGEGYAPEGELRAGQDRVRADDIPEVALLAAAATLCSDAIIQPVEDRWQLVGDPTEGALVAFAARAGLDREQLATALPRVAEIPFDADRKRMTTLHRVDDPHAIPGTLLNTGQYIAFTKGAPDLLLQLSTWAINHSGPVPMDPGLRQRVQAANAEMAGQALRVLGLAFREFEALPADLSFHQIERELTLIGLAGIIDPPRPEAAAAIAEARAAGIRTVMITGDHADTARAIATHIGLMSSSDEVLSGPLLDSLTDVELAERLPRAAVFARVSPEHKVRIVDAVKAGGQIVAMTGDGINDAPALQHAHIGVAMGITGTDVSRAAADMVLTDDNFASIVHAVEEGRVIYANIRKFVFYLLSCNIGEILIIFGALLLALAPGAPLLPIHLLWLNLVTDGLPALALGLEPGAPDVMRQAPRDPGEAVLARRLWPLIAVQALIDAMATLVAFSWAYQTTHDLVFAQTVAYTTLASAELLRAFTSRSQRRSLASMGLFSNPWLLRAVLVSFALLLATLYVPLLQPIFQTVPLGADTWLVILPLALLPALGAELTKAWLRRRDRVLPGAWVPA